MNFARAWLSRLISLGTVSPYKQPKDRLQAARENLAASLKPDPDYRRGRLAHLSSERVQRYWENVEGLLG